MGSVYADAKAINTELFELVTPEYYNKNVPRHFREKLKIDTPMVNGVHVTWEEWLADHPGESDPRDNIPEPIYQPFEMNMGVSREPVSAIIDYLANHVDISIGNPDKAYPRIIRILEAYLEYSNTLNASAEILRYVDKVQSALALMRYCYNGYLNRQAIRVLGSLPTAPAGSFDKIESKFFKNEGEQ